MHDHPPAARDAKPTGNSEAKTSAPVDITALLRAQRFQEAREAIEHGLVQTPDDTRLLRRLAWACNRLGDADAAQDALDRFNEAIAARNASQLLHAASAYDHDAVSATEYAEILRTGAPAPDESQRSNELLHPAHPDTGGCVTGLTEGPPTSNAINTIADTPDEEPFAALADDDALSEAIEESPAQILKEAFADAPGSPIAITIFDESAPGLEALDLIEINEARHATRLTGSAPDVSPVSALRSLCKSTDCA